MKNLRYILLVIAAAMAFGCMKVIDDLTDDTTDSSAGIVEVLEDGRFQVTAQLNGVSMTSVVTRTTADEDRIYDGWCLVFGEDEDNVGKGNYSDDSPLIQLEKVTINANGTFTMVFDEYPNTAFMRIVVNLTDREDYNLENYVTSWRMAVNANPSDGLDMNTPPTRAQVLEYGIATFGKYRHQSVGLDGIYNVEYNTTSEIVDYEIDGYGFTSTSGDKGYKDVVDYSDYGNPQVTSVVQYSVNYQTSGGEAGTSTVTDLGETYNTNRPDPASPKTTGFPMASYGFMMSEISEETLENAFESVIDMIRVCSKMQVSVTDTNFDMEEVYLIGAAQESRIRSSVLQTTGEGSTTEVNSSYSVPVDLGGTINYMVQYTDTKASDPIYFYPNSGGGYVYNDGAVDQDINPQYIIIKGQSSYYDTPGYYKIALKAEYPLDATGTETSGLTYDILRNTSFTVNLLEINKPGYKTYDDAADPDSPANNISYSVEIESSNNRYEVLVSKGTYWAELETSRVYIKGYMDEGIEGCYIDFTMTPTDENTVPTVYVQSSDHNDDYSNTDVEITHCLVMRDGDSGYTDNVWDNSESSSQRVELTDNKTEDGLGDKLVKIESSKYATKVRVYFDATDSGRIRLRIGDMLKFIPVVYDRIPISIYGTIGQDGTEDKGIVVEDSYGTSWDDFSYSKVEYDEDYIGDDAHAYVPEFVLTSEGTVTYENNSTSVKPELRARIYPKDAGDGNAVLYLRQASDFAVTDSDGNEIPVSDSYEIIFNSQSVVKSNNTGGLFTTNSDGVSVTCDLTSLGTSSVDDVTVSISNEITTKPETKDGNVGSKVVWDEFFNSESTNNGQTLTLTADSITYDISSTVDVSSYEGTEKGTKRQEWLTDSIRPYLVTYNNTAISTVTITNIAGDYKEYTVNQTQYPPLYLIDASGEPVKQFKYNATDYATVFAMNIWNTHLIANYSSKNGTYGFTSSYISNDATSTTYPFVYTVDYGYNYHRYTGIWPSRNGETAARKVLIKPYMFNSTFISNYNWSSSTDKSGAAVSATLLGGTGESVTPVEMWKIGGDQYADAVIGIVRSDENDDISGAANTYYAMMLVTITVRDIYGDTYSVVKKLYVATDTYEKGTMTEAYWAADWASLPNYYSYDQRTTHDYNTY